MFKRSYGRTILWTLLLFGSSFLLASCGPSAVETGETIIKDYYGSIEAGDAETAASFFAEDVVIDVGSGSLEGINEVKSRFIPFDMENMESVSFLSDFTERDGWVVWSQRYDFKEGGSDLFDCEVKIEDGKITNWRLN